MPPIPKLSTAQKLVLEYYKAKINLMHVVNDRWAAGAALDLFTRPYAGRRKKDPPLWKDARTLRLPSGQGTMRGYHWQPKGEANGRQLLVVHGFAGSCKSFDKYIATALAMGYSVVAYDAPGHGKSDGRRLNVNMYRWFLEDVLRHHGHFHAYLAHSIGGMALLLALEGMPAAHESRIAMIAPLTEGQRAADNFFGVLQLPDTLRQAFEAEIQTLAGHPMSWFSMRRLATSMPQRVLWVHDHHDDTTPIADVLPIVAMQPPQVEFYLTEGLGHTRIYRDNKVRKAVTDFWRL